MAEWGKYLKNAVANVEQQLDKVLLENQEHRDNASKPARTRPDLSERLKVAAAGKSTPPASASESQADKLSTGEDGTTEKVQADAKIKPERTISTDHNKRETHALPKTDEHTQESNTKETQTGSAADKTDFGKSKSVGNDTLFPETELPLSTIKDLVSPPDFTSALTKARQSASAVKRDDAVSLVDALEGLDREAEAYNDSMNERLKTLHSKLASMCSNRASTASGADKKVALLMEEGQLLSQQESKSNMTIKKLRAEKRDADAKLAAAESRSRNAEQSRRDLDKLRAQNRENEVLISNFRAQSKEESRVEDISEKSADKSSASEKLEQERDKWHQLEAQLLQRIADSEQVTSKRHETTSHLQESLATAQKQSRQAQDQIVSSQDEMDALKQSSQLEITKLQAASASKAISEQSTLSTDQANSALTSAESGKSEPSGEPADNKQDEHSMEDDHNSSRVESYIDENAVSPYDAISELGDEQTVGPAGPFAGLDENTGALGELTIDDGLYGIENETSRSGEHDSFSFLTDRRSRQDSMAGSMTEVADSHIVKKLTLSLRKLQNEVSVAKQDAELARQQRQDAQAEIVKHLGAQEQLRALQSTHDELTAAHAAAVSEINRLKAIVDDKTEQIDESEADVRDLKEMYKDQIEALISEIEKLKRK